jgi:hypothetical protein
MTCGYTARLESSALRQFGTNPKLAETTARVLGRLQRGGYYEQGQQQGSIARWPYDSEDIWVIAKASHKIVETGCTRDVDGWPCARTRLAA